MVIASVCSARAGNPFRKMSRGLFGGLWLSSLALACGVPSDGSEGSHDGAVPWAEEAVGHDASAWSAEAPDEEGRNSHLFLVNGALDSLARYPADPTSIRAWQRFSLPACRQSWQLGLFDADHRAPYNGGRQDLGSGARLWRIFWSGARYEYHF